MGVPMSRSDDKRRGNRFLATAVKGARDMVSLRDQTILALRQQVAELVTERDEARADAWRYRWLKGRNPSALATVAWCCPEACKYPDPDRAIDAAMAAEERDA